MVASETTQWHVPIWALGWDAVSRGRCADPPKKGSLKVALWRTRKVKAFDSPVPFSSCPSTRVVFLERDTLSCVLLGHAL